MSVDFAKTPIYNVCICFPKNPGAGEVGIFRWVVKWPLKRKRPERDGKRAKKGDRKWSRARYRRSLVYVKRKNIGGGYKGGAPIPLSRKRVEVFVFRKNTVHNTVRLFDFRKQFFKLEARTLFMSRVSDLKRTCCTVFFLNFNVLL